MLIPSIKLNRT